MDVLSRLESRVEQLLTRLEALTIEKSRLERDLATAIQENRDLTAQNLALKQSLEQAADLRKEALSRLRALMRKISDYG